MDMKGEENKTKILENAVKNNYDKNISIAGAEKVGKMFGEANSQSTNAMQKTGNAEIREKLVASDISEITLLKDFQSTQVAGEPYVSAKLDTKIFKDTTLELVEIKSILKSIPPYYVVATLKPNDSEKSDCLFLLPSAPEFDITKYSEQIIRVREHIINRLIELKLIKTGKIVMKFLLPELALYGLRSELSDEDLILHSYYTMSIFIYDDILDRPDHKVIINQTIIINQAFQIFLEILQGKYANIDTITPIDFPNFILQCRFLFDIRHMLAKRQLDLVNEFLSRQEKVFTFYIQDVNNVINKVFLSSYKYLEMKKISSFAYSFLGLHYVLKNVSLFSFKDYAIFYKFEACAVEAQCMIADILSVYRDIENELLNDNYVLIHQAEHKCSLEDAFNATVKLINILIIKMYSLKKIMQQDPIYKDNKELFEAVVIIENFVQGSMDWSLEAKRFQSTCTISVSRLELIDGNFPLMQFFENKTDDIVVKT